ncbi:unnamed protein product [Brassica napus]|uniref:(rape) hypothetical protein n=1 Tax=Brassica napus TaxID=3708 RepID=A0A816IMU7_BRANA|nr:unnamed protein product [Brassica napus]
MIGMICQHMETRLIILHRRMRLIICQRHLRNANHCHLMCYTSRTPSSPRHARYRASAM